MHISLPHNVFLVLPWADLEHSAALIRQAGSHYQNFDLNAYVQTQAGTEINCFDNEAVDAAAAEWLQLEFIKIAKMIINSGPDCVLMYLPSVSGQFFAKWIIYHLKKMSVHTRIMLGIDEELITADRPGLIDTVKLIKNVGLVDQLYFGHVESFVEQYQ